MSTERRILRHEVHLHDDFTVIEISGPVVKVANQGEYNVEFWTLAGEYPEEKVKFKVVGTGHTFDSKEWDYVGTAPRTEDGLVWHLLAEVPEEDQVEAVFE